MAAKARHSRRRDASAADPREARWALTALAAALLPFFVILPPWVAGTALALTGWRATLLLRRRKPPPAALRLGLAALALVAVVLSFRGLGGAEAGGAFLALASSLKALESRSPRDFRIVALLTFFLLAAVFLEQTSLPMALYASATIWIAVTAFLVADSSRSSKALVRRAGALLAAALPVAAALFLLFPRLPGPLFRFGAPRSAAVTGLPNQLDPGAIASLAVSNAIAFRVHFDGAAPPRAERYFRGPVFVHYDGHQWLPGENLAGGGGFHPVGQPLHYRVLERASGTRYLFALALPSKVSTQAQLTRRDELLAPHPLWVDVDFQAISYPHHYMTLPLSPAQRAADLALPRGADPRARALAARWRTKTKSAAGIVAKALAWFRRKPFYYTLTPGRLTGPNPVDQFLFSTRHGFCEHYASAFAVLMRAAGIPTRVVTGYAGGTINPYDHWLVLRQSNAHAWDEVWLNGKGWTRVDPTSVIPASRVESSAAEAAATSPAGNAIFHLGGFWRVRELWDAVNTAWAEYVAGYDASLQHRLLGRLGLGRAGPILTALVMILALIITGVMVLALALLRRPATTDPARRLYARWCRRMARRGIACRPTQGPLDFANHVARMAPALAGEAAEITALYLRARYEDDPTALIRLRRRIHRR